MFNKKSLYSSVFVLLIAAFNVNAQEVINANVNSENLPINVTTSATNNVAGEKANGLVSPSKPNVVENEKAQPNTAASSTNNSAFDFDLKMKQIQSAKNAPVAKEEAVVENKNETLDTPKEVDEAFATEVQHKETPMDSLGNSVLSRIDDDLFKRMSEIEKSTTLLNLELRRERLINEVEAQKAIRQKNADDKKRQEAEAKLKEFEEKKKAEALILTEKQKLLDKEQLFEALKQRKILNAYMNEMLVARQEWLKEKEELYKRINEVEEEKKVLIGMFKERIDKVLEASQKNIQVAELAKANFERVVKNLRTRNEQLRKRVEADAKIIKNAKSNLYLKSKSIDELRDRNAQMIEIENAKLLEKNKQEDEKEEVIDTAVEEVVIEKLNSKYAILGITGTVDRMTIELIGLDGQPLSLKVGSLLPTGHTVSEIGSDFAKFTRDGYDDYLYVGKTIEGYNSKANTTSK